jgi:uncharacterized protein YceK
MKPCLALTVVALLASGCGSGSASEQAKTLKALAAEGAMLAHDASAGKTTHTFTREHAAELAKAARSYRGASVAALLDKVPSASRAEQRRLAGELELIAGK